ncbi:hypothetical protein [Pseudomaricurvus sp. HS19]|uniref:hypothetical protein n=1 Tax=Pseudomaricurvus sp. HS19 TaxID=2692626 RepID=UPI00136B2C4E|nr:hypothetical protein [Pseudomaricurvus sp. HS19]MYM62988.1 hypothetical protein [Pseudomaricurvus sp. HS19]
MSRRGDTKDKLLGELESIKALLNEDEWDDIPLLNDVIQPNSDTPAAAAPESTLEELAQDILREQEAPATPAPDAAITGNRKNANNDIAKAINSLNMDLDLDETDPGLPAVEPAPADTEPESGLDDEADEETEGELVDEATDETDDDYDIDEETRQALLSIDDEWEEEDRLAEANQVLPPGVLPGQRSLFESPSQGSPYQAIPSEESPGKPATTRKASGENPFLPQHIRERLHINRSLVDELKAGTPFQPDASADILSAVRLQQLVDQVIATHLPRIEADLRERLFRELQNNPPRKDKN